MTDELRDRLIWLLRPDNLAELSTSVGAADAVLAEIAAAGYVLVERERLERIGLALWSMIEEEDYRDEILGLEPGDRAAIPGALTGRVGE